MSRVGSGGTEALSKGIGMASRLIGNRKHADSSGLAHLSHQGSLGGSEDLGDSDAGPGASDVQHDMEEAMADNQNGLPGVCCIRGHTLENMHAPLH